jgi:hypothetical protein
MGKRLGRNTKQAKKLNKHNKNWRVAAEGISAAAAALVS